MNANKKLVKIDFVLICIINFFYLFRGILIKYDMGSLVYVLSLLSGCISVLILANKRTKERLSSLPAVFVAFGLVVLFFSIIFTNAIGSFLGFVAFFFNFIMIFLFFASLDATTRNNFFAFLKKYNIFLGLLLGIFGIYQYYVDTSLFGFATHQIYGDAEIISGGGVVKRVTSFMGSPQNYAIFVSIAFLLCVSNASIKRIPKTLFMMLLLFAGMVSGSRSFTLSTGLGLFVYFSLCIKEKNGLVNLMLFYILVFFAVVSFITFSRTAMLGNSTFDRLFTFLEDEPVFGIIRKNLQTVNATIFLFGKGLGNGERLAYEYFGPNYASVYGCPYESYESFFLSLFMQCGIFGLIIYLFLILQSVKNYHKKKRFGEIGIVAALVVNMFFTPSFAGLAMSFFGGLFIIFPLCFCTDRSVNAGFRSNNLRLNYE